MNDRSSELENYNELKFSREQGFFDKNLGIRLLIGLIFTIPLFAILHFREVRVEILELNHYAPSYVVAQVDTDFYNEEATILLKQEVVKDLGKIYRISEKDINDRRLEFENFLIFNQDWRKSAPESSFEDAYNGGDRLVEALTLLRLTDPRTLQKAKEYDIGAAHYQIYTPADLAESVVLPPQIWKKLQSKAMPPDAFPQGTIEFVIDYFQEKPWTLEEDVGAERELRKRIQAKVQDKYTHISAGNRIIDQGEKVNARHVAMLQAMKDALREKRNLWSPLTLLGSLLMTMLLTGICIAYFKANHPKILSSNRKLFLLVTVVILTLGLAKLTEFFLLNTKTHLMEAVRYPLLVPFAAILICSLMNSSVATFSSGFLAVVLAMTLAFERQGFLVMNLTAAIIAILSTHSLRRRKEIFVVCGKAWLGCAIILLSMHLYQSTHWSAGLLADLLSTAIFMLLTAILVVGLLPLLESGFRIMTDVSLMEYMDPNNDLLRRLTIEAPGTYQHSIVVGNLAEAAALSVDANGLFCRVSTLYHDIGKMSTPQYFTENQQGGMNIHQLLTPQESAQVIMAHVAEGVSIARKAGLPEQFIEIIKEHHGTTLVYYFYRKQLEKMGGDKSLVNEKEFRYVGPKPRSKESAIIMIADSLEAASRSLDQVTEEALMELANRLIREKADDGQFDECLLTFEELAIVKSTLVQTLVAYSHSRVKYPKRDTPKQEILC